MIDEKLLEYATTYSVDAVVDLDDKNDKTKAESDIHEMFNIMEKVNDTYPVAFTTGNTMGLNYIEKVFLGLLAIQVFKTLGDYYGELLNKTNKTSSEEKFTQAIDKVSDEFIDIYENSRELLMKTEAENNTTFFEFAEEVLNKNK